LLSGGIGVIDRTQNETGLRIGAVLVTYHPDNAVFENIVKLAEQVNEVVIVDNGSPQEFWERFTKQYPEIKFTKITNSKNLGIATAFNLGARALLASNCDFVMTFDQDSTLPPDYVKQVLEAYFEAKTVFGQIGVFGTYYRDENSGIVFPNHFKANSDFVVVESTISSGNLIPAETFLKIGFFRDDFFIDAVDTEFHLRAHKAGLPLVLTRKLVLPHALGKQSMARLLWIDFPLTSHNYIRRYYMARNRTLTYQLYAKHYPSWFRLELRMFLGDFLTMLIYEKDKFRKLQYTFKGIFDGIQGKTGELEQR
jgi:rhamnosyltransferase